MLEVRNSGGATAGDVQVTIEHSPYLSVATPRGGGSSVLLRRSDDSVVVTTFPLGNIHRRSAAQPAMRLSIWLEDSVLAYLDSISRPKATTMPSGDTVGVLEGIRMVRGLSLSITAAAENAETVTQQYKLLYTFSDGHPYVGFLEPR